MPRWVLRRKLHCSWLLAAASVGIVCGVVIAKYIPQSIFASIPWLLTGGLLIIVAMLRPHSAMLVIAVVGGSLVGMWRGSVTLSELRAYDSIIGSNVSITGKVKDDVETNKRDQLVLRMANLHINKKSVPGTIWVTVKTTAKMRRGDVVAVNGKMTPGFGSFAATMYSATIKNIHRPVPGDIAVSVRDWFASGIQKSINGPESALGIGFLTGQHRNLPEDVDEAMKIVGLTHIVVASGYNLTILVRAARRIFINVSKYLSLLTAGGLIIGFIAMTGLSPSMSRAGIVAGLSLLAWYFGRRFHPFVLLPFVMAITVLFQPSFAWGDLGWQLSFAAFIGIMVAAPILSSYFFEDAKLNAVQLIFIETFAAWICTLPILVYAFGQFSVLAIVANMLVLPLLPLAMLLTFFTGVCAIVSPIIASVPGLFSSLILRYVETVASYLSNVSWALNTAKLPIWGAIAAYACLGIVLIYMARRSRISFLDRRVSERMI